MLNLVVVEGEGATNNIRQRTARAPVVQAEDENYKPVAGAIVVFTLPSNGASGAFADRARILTMVSDSKGQPAPNGFRANGIKGQFKIHVNASFQGQTAATEIAQTNAALTASGATASTGASTKLIVVLGVLGAAAAGGPTGPHTTDLQTHPPLRHPAPPSRLAPDPSAPRGKSS
jgi:hypothetical protein